MEKVYVHGVANPRIEDGENKNRTEGGEAEAYSEGVRCMGAGRTGRHLLGAAKGRKLFLKIHVKIQIVISCVCVQ